MPMFYGKKFRMNDLVKELSVQSKDKFWKDLNLRTKKFILRLVNLQTNFYFQRLLR